MSKTEEVAFARMGASSPSLVEIIAKALQNRAVDATMAGVLADERRRPKPEPSPIVQARPEDGVVTPGDGAGWTNPPSIDKWRPPGHAIADRMLDQQDAIDRRERERRMGGK